MRHNLAPIVQFYLIHLPPRQVKGNGDAFPQPTPVDTAAASENSVGGPAVEDAGNRHHFGRSPPIATSRLLEPSLLCSAVGYSDSSAGSGTPPPRSYLVAPSAASGAASSASGASRASGAGGAVEVGSEHCSAGVSVGSTGSNSLSTESRLRDSSSRQVAWYFWSLRRRYDSTQLPVPTIARPRRELVVPHRLPGEYCSLSAHWVCCIFFLSFFFLLVAQFGVSCVVSEHTWWQALQDEGRT